VLSVVAIPRLTVTNLAVWGNHGPTIIHWEESPQSVTVNLRLGDVMPLLSSATGRCFAAYVSREAIAPLLREELARARQLGRTDLPRTQADLTLMLRQVREHGLARAVDSLLPGVAGFCAPVFDFDGHLVLGMVAMGSVASFDTAWDGSVATPLKTAAPFQPKSPRFPSTSPPANNSASPASPAD